MTRIHHFKIRGEWSLLHYIESYLQLNVQEINALIDLGSLYLNGNRCSENIQLTHGDYLRVHSDPRRFKIPKKVSEFIIFEDEFFIALNKPQGQPCHPTLDNNIENCLKQLCLERNQIYFLCHRLDIGTEGVLLFAKSKELQTHMMKTWTEVRKIYRAQTHGPKLEPQVLQHWMRPHPRAPKILARKPVENWLTCELRILKSNSVATNISFDGNFNEYEIELLTGRTHQIRAQLSFEQNPIIGDSMYGSSYCQSTYDQSDFSQINITNSPVTDQFALKCIEISFYFADNNYKITT